MIRNRFRLKRPLGIAYTMDEDDVLKTKTALRDLGHMKRPGYGLTPYPDRVMIDGIRDFQKKTGLKVDGVMKPGGPTERRISEILAGSGKAGRHHTRGIMPGEWDWQRYPLRYRRRQAPDQHKARPLRPPKDQVALAPFAPFALPLLEAAAIRALPYVVGGLASAGVGVAIGEKLKHGGTVTPAPEKKGAPTANHTDPAPSYPPVPPSEPPGDRKPEREEFPAKPPFEPIDLSKPLPEPAKPTIFIHPLPPAEWMDATPIERNETEATKKQLDGIRDDVIGLKLGWDHIGGGRDQESGEEKKEYYIAGHGYAFPRQGRKTGDGRRLSGYTDLTFKAKDRENLLAHPNRRRRPRLQADETGTGQCGANSAAAARQPEGNPPYHPLPEMVATQRKWTPLRTLFCPGF